MESNIFDLIKDNDINEFSKCDIYINNLTYSPLKGEKSGNIEYLALFSKKISNKKDIDIKDIINKAYNILI